MYSTVMKPTPVVPEANFKKIEASDDPMSAQVSPSVIVPAEPYLKTFAAVPAASAEKSSVAVADVPTLMLAAAVAVVILIITSVT